MKNIFKEYYPIDNFKTKVFWKEAAIVLDTNILLDLYRLNEDGRNDIFKTLENLKDSLWMPYQVGYEYHKNRRSTIDLTRTDITSTLKNTAANLDRNFKALSENPLFDKATIHDNIASFLKNEIDKLETQIREKGINPDDDKILKKITELYNTKVGKDYSEDELKELYKEGDKRIEAKIPPGYKDRTKSEDMEDTDRKGRRKYGDFLIWKQTIKYANDNKKNIIFITNDLKEDWYNERKMSFRVELIREFNEKTDQKIVLLTFRNFQKIYKTIFESRKNPDIESDPTIKELSSIEDTNKNRTLYRKKLIRQTRSDEFAIAFNRLIDKLNESNDASKSTAERFLIRADASLCGRKLIQDFPENRNLIRQILNEIEVPIRDLTNEWYVTDENQDDINPFTQDFSTIDDIRKIGKL